MTKRLAEIYTKTLRLGFVHFVFKFNRDPKNEYLEISLNKHLK